MMGRIALSSRNHDESGLARRYVRITLVLVGLVALAGVAVTGGVLADSSPGGSQAVIAQDQADTAAADINVTRRNISTTTARPGETVTVEVFVDTEGSLGSTELVEVTDTFSSAFENVELNESDPDPSGAAPGPNNEEFLSIWNVDRANYTVSYDVTIPSTAEGGDTFDITGTVEVGSNQQSLPSETITVTTDIPEETTVELQPADETANPNGQTTFDVVVTGAGDGVGGYSVNVSSSDVNVGEITSIDHTNTPATDNSQVASDGSWGLVAADLGSNSHGADFSVTVAEITVDTGQTGTSDFTVDSGASVSNSTGDDYGIDSVMGATLTVQESASFGLSNLIPQTTTVNTSENFDVSVDVTNNGDVSGQQDIELRTEPSGSTLDTLTVQLDSGETKTVTFQDVSVSTTGEYNHTVVSNDDQVSGDLTVQEPPGEAFFEVDSFSPNVATVEVGEEFDVTATINNTGDAAGEQTIEYRLPSTGTVLASTTVSLNAGSTTTVTFENVSVGTAGGYAHEVASEDDSLPGDLTVEESGPGESPVDNVNLEQFNAVLPNAETTTIAQLRTAVDDWAQNQQVDGVPITLGELRAIIDWWVTNR
jgi:hypothetical protein